MNRQSIQLPLVKVAISLLLTISVSTTPLRADTPDPSQPITRITFPGRPWVGKAVFSKDGESLFVHLPNNAINLWEVFTYHWPEALGALLILTAIICCLAMARVVRSKRIPGAPHCRKCNYCLLESTRDRCPECNHLTKRPIKGRPQWLRLLPWSTALIALAAFYLFLWIANVPRTGEVSHYFNWWSSGLLDWAKQRNITWLIARASPVEEIVEFETKSGRQERTLICRPGVRGVLKLGDITPDGQFLIATLGDHALITISTATGCIRKHVDCPDLLIGKYNRDFIEGFDDAMQTAFVSSIDEKARKTKLLAWSWDTQRLQVLLEAPIGIWQQNKFGLLAQPRYFYPIPRSLGKRFLESSSRIESAELKNAVLRVREINDSELAPNLLTTGSWVAPEPAIFPDGSEAVIHRLDFFEGLTKIDLHTGKLSQLIHLPNLYFFHENFAIQRNRKLLVVWTHFGEIGPLIADEEYFLIYDLNNEKWIGRFAGPNNWTLQDFVFSQDGRFLLTQHASPLRKALSPEIRIYDMQTLPHQVQFSDWPEAMKKRIKNNLIVPNSDS